MTTKKKATQPKKSLIAKPAPSRLTIHEKEALRQAAEQERVRQEFFEKAGIQPGMRLTNQERVRALSVLLDQLKDNGNIECYALLVQAKPENQSPAGELDHGVVAKCSSEEGLQMAKHLAEACIKRLR